MFKFYSLTAEAYDAEISGAKLPLQQKQIYSALVRLGKPSRGVDVVANAVEHGLVTKQAYDVLAAWYFSPKRRPDCVRLGGEAQGPVSVPTSIDILATLV